MKGGGPAIESPVRGLADLVSLPVDERTPAQEMLRRVGIALAIIAFIAAVTYGFRDGFVDAKGDDVSVLDALYYASVTATTTGYGDIRPESDAARTAALVLITPARILFLIILVGTTLEVLAGHTRRSLQISRWRKMLTDHVIVCGYGTKGRSAVVSLRGQGLPDERIVVIDENPDALAQAERDGLATVAGSATRTDVLHAARIHNARAVIVGPDRDDAAVLITLTAREHNPRATIVAAVREEENAHLLRQSGADQVVLSSGAAGHLLGLATHTPATVQVIEDLMTVGAGLDVVEREIAPDEAGPLSSLRATDPIVAVLRAGELLRFDDERAQTVEAGDRLIYLCSR